MKKILLFLILGIVFFVTSYAKVIIINSGGESVTCQYGANSIRSDNTFSIKKYETRFVGYESNGLLSCDGYPPSHLIAHDDVTIYLDDTNKVINTYEASKNSGKCNSQVKDCEVSYIVNTYYNSVICYSYSSSPTSESASYMNFADPFHFTKFPHSKTDLFTCDIVSDSTGFGFPENKILLLLLNGGSLWLLPFDVDYSKTK